MKKFKKLVLIISAIGLASCGKINSVMDSTEAIPEKMNALNRGMSETNESIRLQKLAIALDQVMKKENQQFLSPIPGDMMAPGKLLAETLTASEAVELLYIKLKNVNENTYRDQYPADDGLTNKAQIEDFERSKIALLYAVQIISTFLPDSVLNQIIDTEVKHAGRFRQTAFQILMMRATFYDKVMLHASLLSDAMNTVGMVQKAIEYNTKIDFISKLKFADRIELKITGFLDAAKNDAFSQKLNIQNAAKNWAAIQDRASTQVEIIGVTGNEAEDQAEMAQEKAMLAQNLETIKNYLNSWPTVVP